MKTPTLPLPLRRVAARHRRLLAAAAAALAVAAALTSLQPDRGPTVTVVTAARAIAPGTAVADADVTLTAVPESFVPPEALTSTADAVGLAVTILVGERSILTRGHVAAGLAVARPGLVVVALPLTDEAIAPLIRPGSRIDLYGATASGPGVLASDVRVVATPAAAPGIGGLTSGRVVLVEVSPEVAARLATPAGSGGVTVALR